MKLYHGSKQVIKSPSYNGSRDKTDFGRGFYLTPDEAQAQRWAVRGNTPIVNCYDIDLEKLVVHRFELGLEWLLFIIYNRKIGNFAQEVLKKRFTFLEEVDVIMGPTADDKMYNTLEEFFDGDISLEKTLDILNCMELSEQYLIKTMKGIQCTQYVSHDALRDEQLQTVIQASREFVGGIKTEVKYYQRKHYEEEHYIEDIERKIQNGAQ
ncbi:MAG: DUF3990 domain-containing protein [Cellulosilyticaceae bacterium]